MTQYFTTNFRLLFGEPKVMTRNIYVQKVSNCSSCGTKNFFSSRTNSLKCTCGTRSYRSYVEVIL